MSGGIISGSDALAIGLITHLSTTKEDVQTQAVALAESLAKKPPHALQTTKKWLNELDGSLQDKSFDGPAKHSASSLGEETENLLRQLWKK
jgi:enoyl-CoA hydratase/carnithine racemase